MNLNQVTIPSTNLERSVKFYQTLGLQLIVNALPRYVRFSCPDGNSSFSLHLVEKLNINPQTVIYFESTTLDTTVNHLKNQGIVFQQEPTDQSWLWREARLFDPDGNHICLYYAGKNRINPPWSIQKLD